jgi:DNA-binding NarL/FixJ family response regulator/tRNA A-37 threonylcarbamoyl transferase component Bud32
MTTDRPAVLLAEDQQLLRMSLKIALQSLGFCTVVGEAADGEEAVREANRLRPDVVLMDFGLPKMSGAEATWLIKQDLPHTRVIILTSRTDRASISSAFGSGADAYCTKNTAVEKIVEAIQAVIRGDIWLDPLISDAVLLDHEIGEPDHFNLSTLELEILDLIREDRRNHEIAMKLSIAEESIAKILSNIMTKFAQKQFATPDKKLDNRELERLQEWLTAVEPHLSDGEIFEGKYTIESCLGSGGMGSVYKARHLFMDRVVALKRLRAETAEDKLSLRCFQREATAIALIQHPNIVTVYDFGITKMGEPYLLMEYIDGVDLCDLILEHGRLSLAHALSLCLQVCDGLSAAHERGIIHCDLKPSNILIQRTSSGELVKLVDFGLVQIAPKNPHPQVQVTHKNSVSGTPSYMAPEQCLGKPADARTDIYALGAIMFEVLTGKTVFTGKTAFEIFAKQMQTAPPTLSSTVPECSFDSELEQLVSAMLAKKPDDRPQSMQEVKQRLLELGQLR